MKASLSRLLGWLVVCLLAAAPAWADTLELKDGKVVQGKYLGGTATNIRFQVDKEVKLFPVADVLAITFGSAAAPAAESGEKAGGTAAGSSISGRRATLATGTRLMVRMIDGVDSETNKTGDKFRASLEEDLVVDNVVVVPKGSEVAGQLVEVQEAGRIKGKSELKLELTELVAGGRTYPLVTGDYEVAGESRGADTAKKVGIGAAAGAVIGAIAGGGKGAAIGAGVGAGAGTAIQVLTKGEQVKVPSETMLEFALEQPLTVTLPSASRAKARP